MHTLASNILEQAQQLSNSYQNTTATTVDVTSEESLSSLIQNHELVVRWANGWSTGFILHVLQDCLKYLSKVVLVINFFADISIKIRATSWYGRTFTIIGQSNPVSVSEVTSFNTYVHESFN